MKNKVLTFITFTLSGFCAAIRHWNSFNAAKLTMKPSSVFSYQILGKSNIWALEQAAHALMAYDDLDVNFNSI